MLDTRVLVDTKDPECETFESASNLIELILKKVIKENKKIELCVDSDNKGKDPYHLSDIGINKSKIISEYIKKLGKKRTDNLGWELLIELNKRNFIKTKSRRAPTTKQHNFILKHFSNKKDRWFVCITCNTISKILTSDEQTDFGLTIRKSCCKRPLNIYITFTKDPNLIKKISSI